MVWLWILILGNHDLYYKNTSEVNSCEALLKYDNITIYADTITKDYDGCLITLLPWIHKTNIEDTLDIVSSLVIKKFDDYCDIL